MGWAGKARSGGVGDERNVRMAGLELLRARAKVVAVPSEVQVAQFGVSFPTLSPSQNRISASHQRNASPALPSLHRTMPRARAVPLAA